MDTVIKAIPLDDYLIKITMGSGLEGLFDVKPYLHGSAFEELKDTAYFKTVRPIRHGITWPHEQDFSADTIAHDIVAAQQGGPPDALTGAGDL